MILTQFLPRGAALAPRYLGRSFTYVQQQLQLRYWLPSPIFCAAHFAHTKVHNASRGLNSMGGEGEVVQSRRGNAHVSGLAPFCIRYNFRHPLRTPPVWRVSVAGGWWKLIVVVNSKYPDRKVYLRGNNNNNSNDTVCCAFVEILGNFHWLASCAIWNGCREWFILYHAVLLHNASVQW